MGQPRRLNLWAGSAGLPLRNTARPVVLIGFLHQGNLGLGYLAATLRAHGYRVHILDFEADPARLVTEVMQMNPLVVGFSLIFQFYLPRFASLIRELRTAGCSCHFTMGGHFPSLSTEETLAALPELDTVVRFEGEHTLLELCDRLGVEAEWREVPGLAFTRNGAVERSAPRALVEDLDSLPWPAREFEPEAVLGHRAMPLLASRGCSRTCSFCSIHTFYRAAPGKVVRTRRPMEVVREMRALHDERGATIFLFQDDDFPVFGPAWKRWTRELLQELDASGLVGKIIWKINCRADAVDAELFAEMKARGLFLVYMGLESGTEQGLSTLNKRISVQQNLDAVATLKRLGLMYEFGFMLFDPSTTFESVRENVKFLDTISNDGSVAVIFCRMLPYDGTPIKEELARTGRLRGDITKPDYDFLDERIEHFYQALHRLMSITGWVHGYRALSPQLNWAFTEIAVLERLFPALTELDEYKSKVEAIARASNRLLLETIRTLADTFEAGVVLTSNLSTLPARSAEFLAQLVETRDRFVRRHQAELLAAIAASPKEPVHRSQPHSPPSAPS